MARSFILTSVYIAYVLIGQLTMLSGQCCSGGVPMSGTLGLSPGEKKTWNFLLTYDFNQLNELYESSQSLNDRTRRRTTHSTLLEVNYGVSDRFTVSGLFSFVRQEREVNTIRNRSDFTFTQGVGDVILLIKYKILIPNLYFNYSLSVGAGPKLPVGKSNFFDDRGLALPADLQPGSGAYDFIVWSSFERYHFLMRNFTISTLVTYRKTGTNPKYFDVQTYRFGDELALNLQTSYSFFVGKEMLGLSLALRYRQQNTDRVDEMIFPNSGGKFAFLVPGFTYNATPDLIFNVAGYAPVYRNVEGTQLTTSYKLVFSILHTIQKSNIQ